MKTTVAIPVWDNRLSTTLDFARKLVIVEIDGARELSRREVTLNDEPADRRARKIRDLGGQVVLCGAVSQPLARAVSHLGIQLLPFLSGPIDEVLAAYFCDRLGDPRFLLAGSTPGAGRKWRHRRGCWRGGSTVREAVAQYKAGKLSATGEPDVENHPGMET